VVEDYLMMVMELCDRGSLYDVLTKNTKDISWRRTLDFASDMAEGMAALHGHDPPIIHRDMKSLNLLVTKDWRCKVCDFGLSRLVKGDMKTFGRLCGTFSYCSPEVFNGGMATDRSDIFSTGIVLWELMHVSATHKYMQPFQEFNLPFDFQIIVQSSQGLRPSIPAGSNNELAQLYLDCISHLPEERPSAREAANRLLEISEKLDRDPTTWKRDVHPGGGVRLNVGAPQGPAAGILPVGVPTPTPTPVATPGFSGWKK